MKHYLSGQNEERIYGTSADIKPTEGIVDGTVFYEADTKKVFMFASGTWHEQ